MSNDDHAPRRLGFSTPPAAVAPQPTSLSSGVVGGSPSTTSRVALTLAKHRLMTAKFDYYKLRELNAEDVARNPEGTWIEENWTVTVDPTGERLTFDCRTVPHLTLRSIARNTSLDPIFAKHEPILAAALTWLSTGRSTKVIARN